MVGNEVREVMGFRLWRVLKIFKDLSFYIEWIGELLVGLGLIFVWKNVCLLNWELIIDGKSGSCEIIYKVIVVI